MRSINISSKMANIRRIIFMLMALGSASETEDIVVNSIPVEDWTVYRATSDKIPEKKYIWPMKNNRDEIVFDLEGTYLSISSYYILRDLETNSILSMIYPHDVKVHWDNVHVNSNTTVFHVKCRNYNGKEPSIPNDVTLSQFKEIRYSVIDCFLKKITRQFLAGLTRLRWLDLAHNNITDVGQHSFEDLVALEELALSKNPLDSLPNGLFCTMPRLKILKLDNLKLSTFPTGLFRPTLHNARSTCLGNLRELDLSSNELRTIPAKSFSEMKQLTRIVLSDCSIRTLEASAFEGLTNIEYIDINRNWIMEIPFDIFSNMPKLQTLKLGHNNLTKFSFGSLSNCTELSRIFLEMNRIEQIHGSILYNTRLKYMSLNDNVIRSFTPEMFYSNETIAINLTNNQISTINPDDFSLPNLLSLEMNQNNLTFLTNYTFNHLVRLKHLFLRNNTISELAALAFAGLKRLEVLWLDYNNIYWLPAGIFKEVNLLQILKLNNNNLVSLEGKYFEGLGYVAAIYLEHNRIQSIDGDTFKHTQRLQKIALQNNHIEAIPNGTFVHLSRLTFIGLSRNNLRQIPSSLFDGCTQLKEINLSYNELKEFNVSLLSLHSLMYLGLSHNNLRDAWNIFEHFYLIPMLIELDLSVNNMSTLGPVVLIQANGITSILQVVNVSSNRITDVPNKQFYMSPSLKILHLGDNNIKTISPPLLMNQKAEPIMYLFGNPLVCDCTMSWAKHAINNEEYCSVPLLGDGVRKKMKDLPGTQYLCQIKNKCPENCECFADQIKEPHKWTHVKCSNKGLKNIPIGIPKGVNILNVSHNNIGQLDSTTFRNATFPILQILDLSSCKIRTLIGNDIFIGFKYQLKILNLNNNLIEQLNGESFKYLNFLNELHLANNSIKTILDDAFSHLNVLSFLDLRGNELQTLNPRVFDKLLLMLINGDAALKVLNISRISVQNGIKSKWSILLSDNPWDCCSALPLKRWLNNHQSILPDLVDIHCIRENLTESVPIFEIHDSNLTCILEPNLPFQETGYFKAIMGILVFMMFILVCILIVKRFKSHIKLKLFVWFGWRFDKVDDSDKIYDALLSYNGLDGEWVRDELLVKLEEAGYKLCLHERDFRVGEPIIDNINDAIDNSKRTIIVLSNNFLQGGYTMYEFVKSHDDWVRGERDPVILVLYDPKDILDKDELEKHPALNTYISTRTYIDRRNRYFSENIILAMPYRRRQNQNELGCDANNLMLENM